MCCAKTRRCESSCVTTPIKTVSKFRKRKRKSLCCVFAPTNVDKRALLCRSRALTANKFTKKRDAVGKLWLGKVRFFLGWGGLGNFGLFFQKGVDPKNAQNISLGDAKCLNMNISQY